jgi:hypothetical protein
LTRHLSSCSLAKARALFKKYAENFLSEDDLEVKAISLENFVELNNSSKIFSNERVFAFTKTSSEEDAEKMLKDCHEDLEDKLNEIQ